MLFEAEVIDDERQCVLIRATTWKTALTSIEVYLKPLLNGKLLSLKESEATFVDLPESGDMK